MEATDPTDATERSNCPGFSIHADGASSSIMVLSTDASASSLPTDATAPSSVSLPASTAKTSSTSYPSSSSGSNDSDLTSSMPQCPQPTTQAHLQEVPQLRVVPVPRPRPGEAPPRLIVSDHDMQKHHVGQTNAGPIFEECKCPGYYRHDSGVLASGANSSSTPA